jgi:benzoyl-CoA reductase/2-hydroxyglutaryl-CoA dehydratase subunit BcrC/BadD/HgdB
MYELMSAGREMYILELPQKADQLDALAHWQKEVGKFKSYVEKRFDTQIIDDQLRAAIRLMNRERGLRRQLADLMARDVPPLTGRQLLEFKSIISGIDADLEQYEKAIRAFNAAAAMPGSPLDLRQSPPPVRVLLTGVPTVHGAERVVELIESCGAVVVAQENCTGIKPILEDIDPDAPDPLQAIAEKYYHLPCSVMTINERRLESLRALAARFRPQCVIELVWQACLTYDVESKRVRRFVEDELQLPYLKIVTDYSPSDSGRLMVRIEALMETVRSKASGTSGQGSR